MKCKNCGNELIKEAEFCPYCGKEIDKANVFTDFLRYDYNI